MTNDLITRCCNLPYVFEYLRPIDHKQEADTFSRSHHIQDSRQQECYHSAHMLNELLGCSWAMQAPNVACMFACSFVSFMAWRATKSWFVWYKLIPCEQLLHAILLARRYAKLLTSMKTTASDEVCFKTCAAAGVQRPLPARRALSLTWCVKRPLPARRALSLTWCVE